MAKVPRAGNELRRQLDEQQRFIKNSARSFDDGFEGEAKRLALTIRVLAHDTSQSHSLLSQVGLKDTMRFEDLSLPFDASNLLPHGGLTKLNAGPGETKILPLFDDSPVPPRTVSFDEWWNGVVFVDQGRIEHSRRDLVLALANQDGGGHVDPGLDEEYANLSRHNSLGWMETRDGVEQPLPDQVPAAVRHIAHEVLKSLDPDYQFQEPERSGVLMMGAAIHKAPSVPPWPLSNTSKPRKVGRNDPCPCGSGKKFKKCHGA